MRQLSFQRKWHRTSDPDRCRSGSVDSQRSALSYLLQLCLQDLDGQLWTEFVRRSRPIITGVVIKVVRRWRNASPNLVDDLVQETYLKLCVNDFKALREFECEHENALYGFLKVVASHVVHDHFRGSHSQKRGNGRAEEDLEQVSLSAAHCGRSADDFDRSILLEEIDECLESLAAESTFSRDHAIFWLYYRDGFTAKAIAALPSIGLTVKGVESTIHRLTRTVREQLTGQPCPAANN